MTGAMLFAMAAVALAAAAGLAFATYAFNDQLGKASMFAVCTFVMLAAAVVFLVIGIQVAMT